MNDNSTRERPIIFSGPMVKAILDGRKTQTRRIVKPQPDAIYGLQDDRIICYHRGNDTLYGNTAKSYTLLPQQGLHGGERRENLLQNALCGLWEKGVRGMVSATGSLAAEQVHHDFSLSSERESDKECTPLGVHSFSRNALRPNMASPTSRWQPSEQCSEQFEVGHGSRQLDGSLCTRDGDDRAEAPCIKTNRRGKGAYSLGSSKQSLQSSLRRAYAGPELLYDLRDCPYRVGQRLWVRETWQRRPLFGGPEECICYRSDLRQWDIVRRGEADQAIENRGGLLALDPGAWRSPIHMPRWASRITLEITDVRVQRLQDITETDAVVEGVERVDAPEQCSWQQAQALGMQRFTYIDALSRRCTMFGLRAGYAMLWESIHGPGSWATNPWCWCLTFKVVA